MPYPRRMDERRRRVMMSAETASTAAPTASSRKRIEELREARRPSMAYGSRVRRCLRGRWFSLVPVSSGAYVKTILALAVFAFTLILLHDASVRYASIADRSTWVDVLRMNRYGSLGRYVTGLLYLAVAGSAWLVYQLRRYRNDDFSGNYRLWQWIVGTAIVASFASTVPLIEMVGVGIEWILGKRVALSGEDWIELFLMVGGAILALRTVAEMWHYRIATCLMLGGWAAVAIPIAAEWNIIEVEDLNRWTMVTSAPLVAAVLWFAATVGYLRCLFREVRGIEPTPGFIQRLRLVAQPEPTFANDEPATEFVRPGLANRVANRVATRRQEKEESEDLKDDEPVQPKRRWWPSLKRKPKIKAADEFEPKAKVQPAVVPSAKTPAKTPATTDKATEDTNDEADSPSAKTRRFGLGSIMKRRTPAETSDNVDAAGKVASVASSPSKHDDDDQEGDDETNDGGNMDENEIDWSSMSKAERRPDAKTAQTRWAGRVNPIHKWL